MESNYYFIHSYHIFPRDLSNIHSYVYYGKEMVASIKKENIFATQFHPEKSQTAGLKLLAQYFKIIGKKSTQDIYKGSRLKHFHYE